MRFIVGNETVRIVTLEEAGPDVIVRVDGHGIMALRATDNVAAVSAQAIVDAGLTLVSE